MAVKRQRTLNGGIEVTSAEKFLTSVTLVMYLFVTTSHQLVAALDDGYRAVAYFVLAFGLRALFIGYLLLAVNRKAAHEGVDG